MSVKEMTNEEMLARFEKLNGDINSETGLPALIDPAFYPADPEDEKEEDVPPLQVPGEFSWKKKPISQTNFNRQADRWNELPETYRKDALGAMKKILFSPFLYNGAFTPNKWLRWACDKDMLDFKYHSYKSTELPKGKLQRRHYLSILMIEIAFERVQEFSMHTESTVAILDMMYQLREYPSDAWNLALNDATKRAQPIIRIMIDYISDRLKFIIDHDDALTEYTKSHERRALAGLLACRQFAEGLCIITCECRDIVKEFDKLNGFSFSDREKMSQYIASLREEGKEHYRQNRFQEAYDVYTTAISHAQFDSVFYSNRCQASIKLQNYNTATCDAYRAMILKPTWAKVYYKIVVSLNALAFTKEALYWGKKGLELCKDDPDFGDLQTLYKKIAKQEEMRAVVDQLQEMSEKPDPQPQPKSRKKAKKRNKRKAKQRKDDDDTETAPSFPSEDEELELDGNFGIKPTNIKKSADQEQTAKIIKKQEEELAAKKKEEEKRKKEAEKTKKREDERVKESKKKEMERKRREEKMRREEEQKKKKEDRKKKKEEEEKRRQQWDWEAAEKFKILALMEWENQKERLHQQELERFRLEKEIDIKVTEGSRSLLQNHFVDAAKYYSSALEIFQNEESPTSEAIRMRRPNDLPILLYARGMASLNQMIPVEIDMAIPFFCEVKNKFSTFGYIGMVYYGLGRAYYLLNNFPEAKETFMEGVHIITNFPPPCGVITWPGVDDPIPESDDIRLPDLFHDMIQQCNCPPQPAAICHYESCSKEYHRKQIYLSDLHFEGYFILTCEWRCTLCFHLKCWSKFKHELNISGDKDLLGIHCFTPDCQGKIMIIEMIDERGLRKYIKKQEKSTSNAKTKPPTKNKYTHRTSKSEFNLKRRKREIAEAKRKKVEFRTKAEVAKNKYSQNKKQSIKNENIAVDQDLSTATIYLKREGDDVSDKIQSSKSKWKVRTNKRAGPMSLQHFCSTLPGYRRNMSMHEIVEAIEIAKDSGNPFFLPDGLREEIEEFELSLGGGKSAVFTENDRTTIPFLFEYFHDLFTQNGPQDTDEDLLVSQLSLLPEHVQDIISKSGGLVSFLRSSPQFVVVPPYIGTSSQFGPMKKLAKGNNNIHHENSTNSRSSSIDFSQFDMIDDPGLSNFAKDFYQVGAPAEDFDIQGLTGGPEQSQSQGSMYTLDDFGDPERPGKASINSDNLSQFSLEDEVKSEAGSHASFENEKVAKKPAPRKQKNVAKNIRTNDSASTLSSQASGHTATKKQGKKKTFRPEMNETGTQTEGRDEAEKAKEEVRRLLERLETMEDQFTKLKRTSQAREESLLKKLDEARESEKAAQEEAKKARQSAEAEVSKVSVIKKQCHDKIQAVKQREQESLSKQLEAEHNVSTLSVRMQEMRQDLLRKILDLTKERDEKEAEARDSELRVIRAEVEFVRLKEHYLVGTLARAKEESEMVVREYEKEMKRPHHAASERASQVLAHGRKQWMNNAISCGTMMETLKTGYASIVEQINNGRRISELPLPRLEPPPAGPNLQLVLMQLRHGIASNGNPMGGSGDATNAMMARNFEGATNNVIRNPLHSAISQPNLRSVAPVPIHPPQITAPHVTTTSQINVNGSNQATSSQAVQPPSNPSHSSMRKKKAFQDLISKLARSIPELSREQLEYYTHQVRTENNGLTGLLHTEIEQRIRRMMGKKENIPKKEKPQPRLNSPLSHMRRTASAPAPWASTSGASTSTSLDPIQSYSENYDSEDEDSMCPICCDPLKEGRVYTLECLHRFHYDCISKWMHKQRTCPNCRKFMVDTSEFPNLPSNDDQSLPPGLLPSNGRVLMY